MALDAAQWRHEGHRGADPQTLSGLRLCDAPILTFANRLNREGGDPFDLLDKIEQALALDVTPASWPIGMGRDLLGALMTCSPVRCNSLDDPQQPRLLPKQAPKLREGVEMARGRCPPFEEQLFVGVRAEGTRCESHRSGKGLPEDRAGSQQFPVARESHSFGRAMKAHSCGKIMGSIEEAR